MALYPNAADPGNWQSFLIREDVKSLSPAEQKKKYLTEQLQFEDFMAQQRYLQSMSINSLTNQLHQGGGFATNPVLSANFNGTIQAITGNTTQIDLVFNEAVTINTAGGTLVIGVHEYANTKNVAGIDREEFESSDHYVRHLIQIFNNVFNAFIV